MFFNFCSRLFRGFGSENSLLTLLLKKGPKKLQWNPSTNQAFKQLKEAFRTVPILKPPSPSKTFIVEVDTSDNGVGGVISQSFGEKSSSTLLFTSQKERSSAEPNFDMGNRELLAVKVALEVWCQDIHRFIYFFNKQMG